MLLLDPESRATASEALALPYFAEFRDPEEEKEAQPYDHSLDNTDLPLSQWKRKKTKPQLVVACGMNKSKNNTHVCLLGHTFTEILTFKPVVQETKETQL